MPTWMTTLWNNEPGFPLRPLRQIAIPGTHDAGCYPNNWFAYFARTQTHPFFNPLDAFSQLSGGIRYFDVRPCTSTHHGVTTFWTYHGPYWGGRLDGPAGILADVANFMGGLAAAERELVVLNISHFSGFDNAKHGQLIGAITAALGPHLVPHTQSAANALDLFEATYTALLTDPVAGNIRSRVAILYDGALDTAVQPFVAGNVNALPAGFFTVSPKYLPAANPIFLFDRYANSNFLATMRTDQLDKLRLRANYAQPFSAPPAFWPANAVGGVPSTLHLFSWTLTPQPWRSPLAAAQNSANPALLPVFSNATAGWAGAGGNYDPALDAQINVLYVDNYASHLYNNPMGSPLNGVAMPVAIAARLNVGAIWPTNW
jgi:hypothetical protein